MLHLLFTLLVIFSSANAQLNSLEVSVAIQGLYSDGVGLVEHDDVRFKHLSNFISDQIPFQNPAIQNVIEFALHEIGASEVGKDNGGQRIKKYLVNTGIYTNANWCASFITSAFLKAPAIMPALLEPTATARDFMLQGLGYKVFFPINSGYKPHMGDILVLDRGEHGNLWYAHAGIVVAHILTPKDTFLVVIEANKSPYRYNPNFSRQEEAKLWTKNNPDRVRFEIYRPNDLFRERALGFVSIKQLMALHHN